MFCHFVKLEEPLSKLHTFFPRVLITQADKKVQPISVNNQTQLFENHPAAGLLTLAANVKRYEEL